MMDAETKRFAEEVLRPVDEPCDCPKCKNYRRLAGACLELEAERDKLLRLIDKANATGCVRIIVSGEGA